jgi:hypothetical protein
VKRGRAQARARWQDLANGEFDRAMLVWIANVASAIVKADDAESDNDRRGAVLEAVGLFGRYDPERETIRAVTAEVDHTCALIERGNRWSDPRALRRGERSARRREAVAEALGLEETPAAIDKRIRRALTN